MQNSRTPHARREQRVGRQVTVRAVCDRHGALLGELSGTPDAPTNYWSRRTAGLLVAYCRAVRWRCPRGCEIIARGEKLTTAYLAAAARPVKERVIRLPKDISRVPGTSPFGGPA